MPWYTTAHARRDAERQAAKRKATMRNDDDVELLKRAASAAGMRYSANWDPLEDDGDALRLATKLKLSVWFEERESNQYTHIIWVSPCFEPYKGDVDAATRRTIVRAAAAMAP